MLVRLVLALTFVALTLAPGVARSQEPLLLARVGPDSGFEISFTHADGTPVTRLDPGTYRIQVTDEGRSHDFRVHGPGVDVGTTYSFVGTTTLTATFGDGYYAFYCGPHRGQMEGTFTAGAAPTPTLRASTNGASVSLTTTAGAPVTQLDPGRYSIAVQDDSAAASLRLSGPGVMEATQVHTFTSTVWTVTLGEGRYSLFSENDPARLRTSLTVGAPPPPSGARTLTAITGPDFAMTLLDSDGAPATRLDPGEYEIAVRDLSPVHNFHLTGPGVDRSTTLELVGEETWRVTLRAGRYAWVCDPHTLTMRGALTVGGGSTTPPPPPVRRLTLRLSAAGVVSASPRHASAGTTVVTVRDSSARGNVHLTGPGVNRRTGIRFRGKATWRLRLRAGRYRVRSDTRRRAVTVMVM